MAPIPATPRRSAAGRPRKSGGRQRPTGAARSGKSSPAIAKSEPPKKKLRYIPGGPGGGGRYVDEDGNETPVGGTGPGGYNYTGPRGRIGRENAANGVQPVSYPRRDRSTRTRTVLPRSQQPAMRFSSAAQAAAAVQNDGYKPREERGWEEFHPDLDIDVKLQIFSAREVDGVEESRPVTPVGQGSVNGANCAYTPNGDATGGSIGDATPTGSTNGDTRTFSIPGTPGMKRKPGRPPRNPEAFYAARAAATTTPHTPRIAPLQNFNAKERLTLPQPSYRKTDALAKFEDKTSGQVRYVDRSMANVGYQETDIFIRPERRLIKASDSNIEEDLDLAPGSKHVGDNFAIGSGGVGRVEYDMDEQDDKWLEAFNTSRREMDVEPITREIFEITITKIEKEWHALEKRIPKPNPKPPQTHRPRSSSAAAVNGEPQAGEEQDSKCAICDDGDCENTNAIVFCDGCDLAVHQECYGVPFIPEGQWLCRKCQLIGRAIPTCIFCPNTDGAFKQTNSSKWAHLLCAMWIPEVSLGNHTFMEPVMDVEKVPKTRWKLTCYLCNQRMGACIQCGNKQCYQAFHVTCARKARLYLKMKNSHGTLAVLDGTTVLKAFCDKHCPNDYSKENSVAQATREARLFFKKTMKGRLWADSQASALAMAASHRHASSQHSPDELQSIARVSKGTWKLPSGAPVIPAVVYDSVESSLQRFSILKRKEYAAEACKYWTLKRESRRGAALLKRLQLQMEAFSSMEITRRNFPGMGHTGRARLQRRIDFAELLVQDLTKIKALTDEVMKREFEKLKEAELEIEMVDTVYFPIAKLLPPIMEKAISLDIKKTFTKGFKKLRERLGNRYYVLATTYAHDLSLALSAGIEAEPEAKNTEGSDAHSEQLSSPSKQAAKDRGERIKLARRIVKAIHPHLEAAVRAEADLCQKSGDTLVQELDSILEAAYHARPASLAGSIEALAHDNSDEMAGNTHLLDIREQLEPASKDKVHDSIPSGEPMDIDLHDEDAPGEDVEDDDVFTPIPTSADEPIEDSRVSADIGQTADSSKQLKPDYNDIKSSDTPPDTNGYVAQLGHQHPAPPTPPVSNGGALSSSGQDISSADTCMVLTEGGIPWYLKEFDPIGTTLLEERWTARDAALSEELSEIDDDELRGMGVDIEGVDGEIGAAEGKAETIIRTKRSKVKKRKKGSR